MKFILLAVALCGAGCAAPRFPIEFHSDPPGARVFYAQGSSEGAIAPPEFVGTTPCTWTTEGTGDGRFNPQRVSVKSDFVQPVVVFTAEPIRASTNLYPQRIVFHGPALFQPGDKIPQKLFFDLHKSPAP